METELLDDAVSLIQTQVDGMFPNLSTARPGTSPGMAAARVDRGSLDGIAPLPPSYALDAPLVDVYLRRLRIDRADVSAPDLAALTRLQAAHVDLVAYENLGMHAGRAPRPSGAVIT